MAGNRLEGFALLNTRWPDGLEWVHLPCLREAMAGYYDLDKYGLELGLGLECPGCGRLKRLDPESMDEEVADARERRGHGDRLDFEKRNSQSDRDL